MNEQRQQTPQNGDNQWDGYYVHRKVYIAGKVSGLPMDEVRAKFAAVEERLRQEGAIVFNPAKEVATHLLLNPRRANWLDEMRFCLSELVWCHEVHFLPDWKESRGATLEHEVAKGLGLTIVYV